MKMPIPLAVSYISSPLHQQPITTASTLIVYKYTYIYWVSVYLLCPVRVAMSECAPVRWLVIFIHSHRYRTQIGRTNGCSIYRTLHLSPLLSQSRIATLENYKMLGLLITLVLLLS